MMSAPAEKQQPYLYQDAPRLPAGPVVDPREILSSQHPVELEIGPGRGNFILERLAADPSVRILGLEIRRKWATLVQRKLDERALNHRGRVFAEDVRDALPRMPADCLSRIYVHFPDPWWKKRHRKRLLAQEALADQAARLLCAGGEFFVQTDVADRAARYEAIFLQNPAFEPWTPAGARVGDPGFGARSPRERRALDDGLPIVRLRFRKREIAGDRGNFHERNELTKIG
jgi:tRNA (guanine-N7-)-methyltransferase